MRRAFLMLLSVFLGFLAHPSRDLSAQIFGAAGDAFPGQDLISVGLVFGQMDPQTTFRDGGGFDGSGLLGATVNFWLHRYVGLQLTTSRTKHEALPARDGRPSIVSGRDPRIWTTLGDVVLRYPFTTEGAFSFSPYVALGGGWKEYKWGFDPQGGPDARGLDLAWSYAAGLEARFGAQGRFGLRGEFRDLRTPFERFGEDLTHEDRVFTVGLLLNF